MSATATSPRTRLNPKPIDRGTRRLMIAKHLSNIPVNRVLTVQQPLPVGTSWWKKYFDCFTRRRSNSNSNIHGGGKYKRMNKTIRRRRN